MKELSVFIDESGDFGEYSPHSPYYIISMVFHNQENGIEDHVKKLNRELSFLGLENHCVHTGPIVRREEDYSSMNITERRRILNKMISFIKQIDIKYKCFYIEKKHLVDPVDASGKLSKMIATFVRDNYNEFTSYDIVKIYYDNGQIEVNKILSSVFNVVLENVEFKKVLPSDYKLFQVADLICSFKLIKLKMDNNSLSSSEESFFDGIRNLKKNYLKSLSKKEYM